MSAELTYKLNNDEVVVPCKGVMIMGRDKTSDLILRDTLVSRNHAMIRLLGDSFYFVDSGSSNGSHINNRRITLPTKLNNGDIIKLGDTELRFEQQGSTEEFTDSLSFQQTIVVNQADIRNITVLVADIRDFTTISEQTPILILTKVMTEWFQQITEVIIENKGVVDKFIGDCVFARWDSDTDELDILRNVLITTSKIHQLTNNISEEYPELSRPLRIGAGIHSGKASVGIGTDNTALGDAVNTAFRLESASKELTCDIVVSKSCYSLLPPQYWEHKEQVIQVKGREASVSVIGLEFSQLNKLINQL